MKAKIKSIKHYSHVSASVVTNSSRAFQNIVSAIAEGAARSATYNVEEGATVNAVFMEFWCSGVTIDKTFTWCIVKLPSGADAPTFAEMANLGTYVNKKNILVSGQGLAPTNGNVLNLIRNWVHIPKGKQRFGLGDSLVFAIAAVGTNINYCGLSTFKEYN